jgi:hypothetical protein
MANSFETVPINPYFMVRDNWYKAIKNRMVAFGSPLAKGYNKMVTALQVVAETYRKMLKNQRSTS